MLVATAAPCSRRKARRRPGPSDGSTDGGPRRRLRRCDCIVTGQDRAGGSYGDEAPRFRSERVRGLRSLCSTPAAGSRCLARPGGDKEDAPPQIVAPEDDQGITGWEQRSQGLPWGLATPMRSGVVTLGAVKGLVRPAGFSLGRLRVLAAEVSRRSGSRYLRFHDGHPARRKTASGGLHRMRRSHTQITISHFSAIHAPMRLLGAARPDGLQPSGARRALYHGEPFEYRPLGHREGS